MEKEVITKLNKNFEDAAYENEGVEYWLARELQELLGYTQWRSFNDVIEKAKITCEKSNQQNVDHFADVSKMVDLGSGAKKDIGDIMRRLV